MSETILITGGAGFIGSHVADRLVKNGKEVASLDNFEPYYDVEYKKRNIAQSLGSPNFNFIQGDITDSSLMESIITKHRVTKIVHMAAIAGVRPSIENPLKVIDVNVKATVQLLEMCRKFNIQNFVFASTSSIYGVNEKIPFSEEDHVVKQVSPYGISKRSCELYCQYYNRLFSIPTVCLRFFTVYGPRGRPDMAVHKFTRLIDTGNPIEVYGSYTKRDFTYIDDIVDGVVTAVDKRFDFEIINLGNNKVNEIEEVISSIEEFLGKKADVRRVGEQMGDVPITFADISKAQRLLGFQPKTDLRTGIQRFIKWYIDKARDLAEKN